MPKVSVCVITYNQEAYIEQCLQSIVNQDTTFKFEVIVGDDGSSDRTPDIIKKFAIQYPTLIKAIFHKENGPGSKNYLSVHNLARGEYVAHIDGDDYALPGKLQAQAECLDENQDISFAVHAVKIAGSEKIIGNDRSYPKKGTIYDLLTLGTYFVHSSVMYRRKNEFDHSHISKLVDYYLHIERASRGAIFLDNRVLGCYRIHSQGMSKSARYREDIEERYEAAFDRALELGVPNEAVQAARLKKRMAFAIARYLAGDLSGYKNKIYIPKGQFGIASKKHQLLHYTRNFPSLIGIYARLRGLS